MTRIREHLTAAFLQALPPDEAPVVILPDKYRVEMRKVQRPAKPAQPATPPPPRPASEAEQLPEVLAQLDEEALLREVAANLDEELALDPTDANGEISLPRLCRVAAVAIFVALSVLLVVGWPYYSLTLSQRPLHFLHSALRPSGFVGLSLGVLGTVIMAASLLYLVRKSRPSWQHFGALRSWLGFHVLSGIAGPALVLFHANFVPTSGVGFLAFSAMLIVVIAGFIGRYILAHVPRSLAGRELELETVRRRLIVYRRKLEDLGVNSSVVDVSVPVATRRMSPWVVTAWIRVLWGDREVRRELKRLREKMRGEDGELDEPTRKTYFLVKRFCREREWLLRYNEFRQIVGAWRFLHRWLAIVLLFAVVFHVTLAVKFAGARLLGGLN